MPQYSEAHYQIRVPARFLHAGQGAPGPLLILLHGFADTALSFSRRCFPEPDPRFELLAPNGPFPLPQRVGDEWKEAYGWYFADFSRGRIHVHPEVAAGALASLIRELGLAEREKVLVGFSQGGYFLPHLAARLEAVRRLIAIGAGFHPQFFASHGLRLPVSAIHGSADQIIPLEEAAADYERLGEWNQGGRFHRIPGMTHTMNEEGRACLLRELLGGTGPA